MVVHERAAARNLETGAVDPEELDSAIDQPAQRLRLRIRRPPTILAGPPIPVEAQEDDVASVDAAGSLGGILETRQIERRRPGDVAEVEDRGFAKETLDREIANTGAVGVSVKRRLDRLDIAWVRCSWQAASLPLTGTRASRHAYLSIDTGLCQDKWFFYSGRQNSITYSCLKM